MGFKARSTNEAPAQATGRKKAGRPAAGAASANKKKAVGRPKKDADKAEKAEKAPAPAKKAGGRGAAAAAPAAGRKQTAAPAAKKKSAKVRGAGRQASAAASAPAEGGSDIQPLHETIRQALVAALERHHSLRQAAKALQMPYSSFRDKLDQLGIEVPGRQRVRHRSRPAFTIKGE